MSHERRSRLPFRLESSHVQDFMISNLVDVIYLFCHPLFQMKKFTCMPFVRNDFVLSLFLRTREILWKSFLENFINVNYLQFFSVDCSRFEDVKRKARKFIV